ncbi:hypothetical protein KBY97_03070 [Synechococcus sp. ATX 2A4]|nr:hypothetical protein [Synechococcus sp. ATX 2A4]
MGVAGLLGSYLFMGANPRVIHHWLARYSVSTANSFEIKTPAHIEVLIDMAITGDREVVQPSVNRTTRKLIARLQAKGVRILMSSNVTEGAAGVWDPGVGEIRIKRSAVLMGSLVLAEIMAHEAAHVAQSCRAGGLGQNSEPMRIKVYPVATFRERLNSPLYGNHVATRVIELEAFTVGTNPPWAIKLLDHYCKG